jgi:hypothetical protein
MTISQKVFPIWNKDIRWDTWIICWCNSLLVGVLTFLSRWSREDNKNGIALVRAMDMPAVITLKGVQTYVLGERTQLAIIIIYMMVVVAPAAWARGRPRTRAQRRSCARATPFSGQIAHAWQRGLVIVHSLVALLLEVIALVIILLFVGLAALWVCIVMTQTIVVLIVSMRIVRLAVVAIVLVALLIVTILVATLLLVAWFMATCGGKMSRFLFFWLIFILGNLLENASHFVGRLTLLKESDELERVSGHHLVQVCELELMRLGLWEEDLFTLLLCHGYFHRLTKVATLEIAEELYLTPHELVHWHESGLLGSVKPAD